MRRWTGKAVSAVRIFPARSAYRREKNVSLRNGKPIWMRKSLLLFFAFAACWLFFSEGGADASALHESPVAEFSVDAGCAKGRCRPAVRLSCGRAFRAASVPAPSVPPSLSRSATPSPDRRSRISTFSACAGSLFSDSCLSLLFPKHETSNNVIKWIKRKSARRCTPCPERL